MSLERVSICAWRAPLTVLILLSAVSCLQASDQHARPQSSLSGVAEGMRCPAEFLENLEASGIQEPAGGNTFLSDLKAFQSAGVASSEVPALKDDAVSPLLAPAAPQGAPLLLLKPAPFAPARPLVPATERSVREPQHLEGLQLAAIH